MAIVLSGSTGIQNPLGSAAAPSESNTTNSNTGAYFPTGTTYGIATNGSNAMYIDASQNVGIGTSSPQAHLDVSGSGTQYARVSSSTNASFRGFEFGQTGAATSYGSLAMELALGEVRLTAGYSTYGGFQTFYTNGSERMRIDSSGNLLVGTTSTTSAFINLPTLIVNNAPFSKGSYSGFFWENRSATATATTNWYGWYTTSGTIYLYNGSGNIGSFNSSTGAYTALSDATKKKDFESSNLGLDAILQLKPMLYRMKDADDSDPKELGFIAQDVKNVIPQAYVEQTSLDASGKESTYIGLNDRPIIAVLTKALQEAVVKIDNLSAEVTALKAKVGA